MKERMISSTNFTDRVKRFFGLSASQQTEDQARKVALPDPVYPLMPLSVEEMEVFLTPEILPGGTARGRKVTMSLFMAMDVLLTDSRKYSKQPANKYSSMRDFVPKEVKVRGIQEQMQAIRFRLDINDYKGVLEREILKERLFELYREAKKVDPEGVQRYEYMLDKKIRKAARA